MIVVVTGGRNYGATEAERRIVREALEMTSTSELDVLVNGGAPGADTVAYDHWTREMHRVAVTVPAKWRKWGNGAGPIRNQTMATATWGHRHLASRWIPDVCLAFPGGAGTANMVKNCEARDIPVIHFGR